MSVFKAGAPSITTVDSFVINKLHSICDKHFDVLVGDCYGVDTAIQSFFADCSYPKVTVYSCNGKARNNVGRWLTKDIQVASTIRGFEFYRQKDIAMANDADIGFMIWDGESRGTLHNILTLAERNKMVLVYIPKHQMPIVVRSLDEADKLIPACEENAKRKYYKLRKSKAATPTTNTEQLSILL